MFFSKFYMLTKYVIGPKLYRVHDVSARNVSLMYMSENQGTLLFTYCKTLSRNCYYVANL